MNYNQSITSAKLDAGDNGLNYKSFRPNSPLGMLSGKDFFRESNPFNLSGYHNNDAKDGLESFFDKSSKTDQTGSYDFDNAENGFFNKSNHDDDMLHFKIELDAPTFKRPFGKSESEKYKDAETTDNTKDNLYSGIKRSATRTLSVDSKCDTSSFQRKSFVDEMSVFGDLYSPVKQTILPGLNSLVSLSLEHES